MARLLAIAVLALPLAAACGTAPVVSPAAATIAMLQPPPPGTATILGPVTGTGPRTLTVIARRTMDVQLSCLSYAGRPPMIWVRSNVTPADVKCQAPGVRGVGGALYHPPGAEIGTRDTLRIAAPRGTSWLIRIDGSPA